MRSSLLLLVALAFTSCGPMMNTLSDGGELNTDDADGGTGGGHDAGAMLPLDAFADRIVSFMAGPGAGFGQERMPDVVLGPPRGSGATSGALDVLSLGSQGTIVIEFTGWLIDDRAGVDFIVFENAFVGNVEPAQVSVSDDGMTWKDFSCVDDRDAGFPGCAGVQPVFAAPDNGISPTDPSTAGGDQFDLSTVGLKRARFIRIHDMGWSKSSFPPSVGFDLDAVAVINRITEDGGIPQ